MREMTPSTAGKILNDLIFRGTVDGDKNEEVIGWVSLQPTILWHMHLGPLTSQHGIAFYTSSFLGNLPKLPPEAATEQIIMSS